MGNNSSLNTKGNKKGVENFVKRQVQARQAKNEKEMLLAKGSTQHPSKMGNFYRVLENFSLGKERDFFFGVFYFLKEFIWKGIFINKYLRDISLIV